MRKDRKQVEAIIFNEIFDVFSLCFESRDKGDGKGGREGREEWRNKCGRLPADWVSLRCV